MFEYEEDGKLIDWKKKAEETAVAFDNPKVGDRFHEMCSFWVYVVAVHKEWIGILEASGPCTLPEEGKVSFMTKEDFKKRYAYGGMPGYCIHFCDSDNDVKGWV